MEEALSKVFADLGSYGPDFYCMPHSSKAQFHIVSEGALSKPYRMNANTSGGHSKTFPSRTHVQMPCRVIVDVFYPPLTILGCILSQARQSLLTEIGPMDVGCHKPLICYPFLQYGCTFSWPFSCR